MSRPDKSPNDLSVLFERILEELDQIKLLSHPDWFPDLQVRSWDLSRQTDRQIISEMLVAGMKGTGGWYLELGDHDPGWSHRIGPDETELTRYRSEQSAGQDI